MNNTINEEVWKDVVGFEEYYQVSNMGNVRSKDRTTLGRNNKPRKVNGQLLKLETVYNGYLRVVLSVHGKSYKRSVHRLVATSFMSLAPFEDAQVNHINSIKTDNCVDNLEWVTASGNKKHSYKSHTSDKRGEKHHRAELTNKDVLEIRKLYATGDYTQKELSVMFDQTRRNIGKIVNRTNWKHI